MFSYWLNNTSSSIAVWQNHCQLLFSVPLVPLDEWCHHHPYPPDWTHQLVGAVIHKSLVQKMISSTCEVLDFWVFFCCFLFSYVNKHIFLKLVMIKWNQRPTVSSYQTLSICDHHEKPGVWGFQVLINIMLEHLRSDCTLTSFSGESQFFIPTWPDKKPTLSRSVPVFSPCVIVVTLCIMNLVLTSFQIAACVC